MQSQQILLYIIFFRISSLADSRVHVMLTFSIVPMLRLMLFQKWFTSEKRNTKTLKHYGSSNSTSSECEFDLTHQYYPALCFADFVLLHVQVNDGT